MRLKLTVRRADLADRDGLRVVITVGVGSTQVSVSHRRHAIVFALPEQLMTSSLASSRPQAIAQAQAGKLELLVTTE
jgi:hypothetical protein